LKCYLCGNETKQSEPNARSDLITVECPECTFYKISTKVIEWFFDEDRVSPEQKQRISLHVQNHYRNTGKAFELNIDSILQFPK
jgi:hypothetical protein